MEQLAHKRVIKDLLILSKNKEELKTRGIYIYANEQDIFTIECLIIPKHKEDSPLGGSLPSASAAASLSLCASSTSPLGGALPSAPAAPLTSAYTGGFFLFKLEIPKDYPLSPPKATFNPTQYQVRLHPNYYENGYVCLSTLNTWANPDWTPSMSILSIVNILEERFNERALCFEPGHQDATQEQLQQFNKCVRYGVFCQAICNVLENKYPIYANFKTIIREHWLANKDQYIQEVDQLAELPHSRTRQSPYQHFLDCNYQAVKQRLATLLENDKALEDQPV